MTKVQRSWPTYTTAEERAAQTATIEERRQGPNTGHPKPPKQRPEPPIRAEDLERRISELERRADG